MMQSRKYISFVQRILAKRISPPTSCLLKPILPTYENTQLFNQFVVRSSSSHRLLCAHSLTQQKFQYFHASSHQWNSKHEQDKQDSKSDVDEPDADTPEKLSVFQRYKKMLKEYWYVLLPVHMLISPVWFGSFYYAAKSGIDIIPLLDFLNLPEKWISPFRSTSLGYIAVASALYKIATPARYMVTLGGTTFAVKYLTKRGLIKPVPTKAKIKSMIQNKLKNVPDGEK